MVINELVGITVRNVMIYRPRKWFGHTFHFGHKCIISALSHALQHGHLRIFDLAINLKSVEVHSAHGHTARFNI